jgi:hypothetical protein
MPALLFFHDFQVPNENLHMNYCLVNWPEAKIFTMNTEICQIQSFRFSGKYLVCIPFFFLLRVTCPTHLTFPNFFYPNNMWGGLQIVYLHIT